jgi:mannan endo-1,4-beta-mannosidase
MSIERPRLALGLLVALAALGCADDRSADAKHASGDQTAGTGGSTSGSAGTSGAGTSGAGAGGSNGEGASGGSAGSGPAGGAGQGGESSGSGGAAGRGEPAIVKVVNGRFDDGGKPYRFVGANFWPGMNLGSTGPGGDQARLRRELDRLVELGVTNLRVLAASEGPDSEPYRVVPSLMPAPSIYNQEVFAGLDVLLDEMSRRGLRAVMVLNNYWEWSGGLGQYVSWWTNTKFPYRLDPGGSYQTMVAYIDGFYACEPCQEAFRANIQVIVNRVNTVNGRAYKDDPTIFSWQVANEPRNFSAAWMDGIASYIKSLDPKHMVSTGSEGTWAGSFEEAHQSPSIDYTSCHIWVEPWSKYRADDSSQQNFDSAMSFALDYLKDHEQRAAALGKPLVLEEFGLARDGWTGGGKLDPLATVANRDRYYASLYQEVEASVGSAGPLAGDAFWAWAGEARPPSHWAGDPPHEDPGWFSIYDTDTSTLEVIRTHAANVAMAP